MSDLKEDLDRALRTVPVSEAPVERAKQHGRRLRTRRRLSVVAGALAVAAVAAGYPALARPGAASAPLTGNQTATPQHTSYGGDPVVTAFPPAKTTDDPDGLTSTNGQVAQGTVGGAPWHMSVQDPGKSTAQFCYAFTPPVSGGHDPSCGSVPDLTVGNTTGADPAVFSGFGDGSMNAIIGESASNVTYYIVTFADGQYLKLIPVTAGGHRYIAWVAPGSMTVRSVAAYLGAPHATSGQVKTAIPFSPPDHLPVFGLWQGPGLPAAPPRATVTIKSSTTTPAWSVTVYEGPWGTCATLNRSESGCSPSGHITTTGFEAYSSDGGTNWGTAAPGTALMRITLSDGSTTTAKPVQVGDEWVFAFWSPPHVTPASWTAYDASGNQMGSGAVISGTATAAKSASP